MCTNAPSSAMRRRIKYFQRWKPTSTIPILIHIEPRRAGRTFPCHTIRPSGGTIARLIRCTRSMEAVARYTNQTDTRNVALESAPGILPIDQPHQISTHPPYYSPNYLNTHPSLPSHHHTSHHLDPPQNTASNTLDDPVQNVLVCIEDKSRRCILVDSGI